MQVTIDELLRKIELEKQNMGEAGKRREEELLSQIRALEGELAQRDKTIGELNNQIASLNSDVAERDTQIKNLKAEIDQL